MVNRVEPEYESLYGVLEKALLQCQNGKGKERHSEPNEPFDKQVICEVTRRLSRSKAGYPLGQAVKKIYETVNLTDEQAVEELLGAINYIAAAIITFKENNSEKGAVNNEALEMIYAWQNNPNSSSYDTKYMYLEE